ncbi:MAG: DUF1761 domain-containing protein, partial [Bacteroidota bacterium]|nr:DUF1761 domain-containing protein [Bacteroidota bacterium]
IAAFVLAMFIYSPKTDLIYGIIAGAFVGIGWVATSLGTLYLFERRSMQHFWINAGYWIVSFILMGAIIGGWR